MTRPCDWQGETKTRWHLLRVGSDGSSSEIVVKEWRESDSTVFTLWDQAPGFKMTDTYNGPDNVEFQAASMITNAASGVLASWRAQPRCEQNDGSTTWHPIVQTDPNCTSPGWEDHLTTTAGGALGSDVVWAPPGVSLDYPEQPVLELDETTRAGIGANGVGVQVFDASGQIKWTLPGYYPLMATFGGGLIARSVNGGFYEFGPDGTAVGQLAILSIQSWLGNSYRQGSVEQVAETPIAPSRFTEQTGGNPSADGPMLPSIITFVPPEELAQPPTHYDGANLDRDIGRAIRASAGSKLISKTISGANATVQAFKNAVAVNYAAVGYVGHSTLGNGPDYFSIGLHLADKNLVKRPANIPNPQLANHEPAEWIDAIESHARVIFVGACKLGDDFKSLWNITDQTQGRALIVASSSNTDLLVAARVWTEIARHLALGESVQTAVDFGNGWAIQNGGAESQWQVVGDASVRILGR